MQQTEQFSNYEKLIGELVRAELDEKDALESLRHDIKQDAKNAIDVDRSLVNILWFAKVSGVSRFWQSALTKDVGPELNQVYWTKDILAGLSGQKIPFYYLIRGEPKQISLYIGTDSLENGRTLRGLFNSQYPGLEFLPEQELADPLNPDIKKEIQEQQQNLEKIRHFIGKECNHIGIVTGVPTPNVRGGTSAGTQIDRLIRGLYGTEASWAFLVIAEPIEAREEHQRLLSDLEKAVLEEQLRLETQHGLQAWQEHLGQPIAYYYNELLGLWHNLLQFSLYEGGWWVQSYICATDAATYNRAKGLIKGIFSGDYARLDRIRVLDCFSCYAEAGKIAASLSPISVKRSSNEGNSELASSRKKHPTFQERLQKTFKYQTLVSSGQLSALIHLPRLEMPGYYVRESAAFDVSSHVTDTTQSIALGEILDRGHLTGNNYNVHVPDLNMHCLLVGITGSGKTKTSFYLLQQLLQSQQQERINFLVIEPAKREYRELAKLLAPQTEVRIFTLGEEHSQAAPFRLNPFEIRPGISVLTHIDLLKSVFNASFDAWAPLPQVLERAIHEIYRDKGWNPIQSTHEPTANERAAIEGADIQWHYRAYPTLTDLYHKIAELVPKLGYDREVTQRIRAALEMRVNSLRVGAKGLMLDTQLSIPIEQLLKRPTVLELEGIGDDDEKAFIIGLILVSLYEYYRVKGKPERSGLGHITVIEEAHRLLTNVPTTTNLEGGNMRGKSVETFVNMLSEIRAYGEGFLIIDQIPTKLAPEVIKNTALKIMHRMVANDDRQAMGGAMNLTEQQVRQVVALKTGEVVVHGGGKYSDDNAILVKIPPPESSESLTQGEIRATWERFRNQPNLKPIFLPYPTCADCCKPPNPQCVDARKLTEDAEFEQAFAALVMSLIAVYRSDFETQLTSCLTIFYDDFVRRVIHKHLTGADASPSKTRCLIAHALYRYMDRRGWQYGWNYQSVENLVELLLPARLALAPGTNISVDEQQALAKLEYNLGIFCQQYEELCKQDFDPFYGCSKVCPSGHCLYRYSVEPLFDDEKLAENYKKAKDSIEETQELINCARRNANRIIHSSPENTREFRSAALCFLVQKINGDTQLDFTSKENLTDQVIEFYDTPSTTE